ncbi:hypothetical protein QBC45DRAFT_433968 [Copromyces sp. CBS 386.78]|nr:hypothetical protein QBC45DRAFT_433968 [Copromyces sp. CBS 386.78]
MSLFHRNRDKISPQEVPKHRIGFRKSLKRFMGTKPTPLNPEPIAASVLRQSNTPKRSPRNSIINETCASFEGAVAATESLITTLPCGQIQATDDESFPSGLDAKTGDPVVPAEQLSNIHSEGTDASNLKHGTEDYPARAAESNDIPCQDTVNTPKTLWDRAYDALRSSNDPSKSALVAEYERKVFHELKSNISGLTLELEGPLSDSLLYQKLTNKAVLDRAIEDALKRAGERSSGTRSFIDKAGNLTLTLQNFIGEAVKASPEASLVWAGVCLVLPLLTQPVIADEAQRNGFSYVTSRISFWTTLERQLANVGNWTETAQEEFVTLYQYLLEFQVRTVLRYHQGGLERFVQDLSSNVWGELIATIKDQEALLHQDLQHYHNTNVAFTSEVLKQNSNKSLESNARFLEALQEIQHIVLKDAEEKLEDKEKKCLRLFRLTDNQRDISYEWYKSRVEKRVEGTCIWAIEHENFQNWLKLQTGTLLITADPGCGKSVLSKYLIDQYLPQRCPTATICYFFFKGGDQNTVKQALCALLHQLFCQKPFLIKHAMPHYDRNGPGMVGTASALWGTFNNAICDKNAGTIIIVLDALDECESTEFTRLVESLTLPREGAVKLLFTSRPYGDVVFPFEHGDMLDRFPVVRIPGEADDHSEKISMEIDMAIRVRVDDFAKRYTLNDQLKETLWTELCRTPHRTYLWVFLVFDHLKPLMPSMLKRTPRGFKTAIEELPRTVADAYERMLNRSGETTRTALQRALSVLLVARRPLQVEEFKVVVNMESHMRSLDELDLGEDDHDFELRLRVMCGLFLSIHRKKVYFLHQTAREYLLAKSPPLAVTPYTWRHSISELQAHSQLARVCVQYIYLLDPDVVHNPHTRSPCAYCATPFLTYARSYWAYHIRHGDLDDDVEFLTTAAAICEPGSKHLRTWTDRGLEEFFGPATTFSTSLHYPAALGCNPLVQHIIRTMSDEEFKAAHNTTTSTPLTLAARRGYPDTVKLLIEAGAKMDAGPRGGAHLSRSPRTMLHRYFGHGEFITELACDQHWCCACWAPMSQGNPL